MGFLDRLLGGKDAAGEEGGGAVIPFSQAGEYLDDRISELHGERMRQAAPLVSDAKKLAKELGKQVDGLEAAKPPDNVIAQFKKIVSTNKPAYIKGMRRTLEALGGQMEPAEYSVALDGAVESIGKIGFGDGRYLGAVHPEEMKRIQGKSKRLLDVQERLKKTMKPQGDEEGLVKLKKEYLEFVNQQEVVGGLTSALAELKKQMTEKEKVLTSDKKLLAEAEKECESPEVTSLTGELTGAQRDFAKAEELIHERVSRLKRGLRKFSRHSVADSGMVDALLADPVPGFLASDHEGFTGMLGRFTTAVEGDQLKLKDRDKTLARIREAMKELTPELRSGHEALAEKVGRLKAQVGEIAAFKHREKAQSAVKADEERLRELRKEAQSTKEKVAAAKEDVAKMRDKLRDKLAEVGAVVD